MGVGAHSSAGDEQMAWVIRVAQCPQAWEREAGGPVWEFSGHCWLWRWRRLEEGVWLSPEASPGTALSSPLCHPSETRPTSDT